MEGRSAAYVQFFRSTLLPAAIVVLFGLALFAVSARIWLPGDMASAPAGFYDRPHDRPVPRVLPQPG